MHPICWPNSVALLLCLFLSFLGLTVSHAPNLLVELHCTLALPLLKLSRCSCFSAASAAPVTLLGLGEAMEGMGRGRASNRGLATSTGAGVAARVERHGGDLG
jgi:hypothetical protein